MKKAIKDEDVEHIKARSDFSRAAGLDHEYHLKNPPHTNRTLTDAFNNNIANSPEAVSANMGLYDSSIEGGVSPKVHFSTSIRGRQQHYMVKPYHEQFNQPDLYQSHPYAGWAEMASQELYHVGGLGHLHQKVHTFEHGGVPMIAVVLEPLQTVHRTGAVAKNNIKIKDDMAKMAMMDFLTHSNDRHTANLMFEMENNIPVRPVAIDHGRSFAYKQTSKFNNNNNDDTLDHLFYYFNSPGYKAALGDSDNSSLWSAPHLSHAVSWWKANKPKITKEWNKQVNMISDPFIRRNLEANFNARVRTLDRFSRAWKQDSNPLHFLPDHYNYIENQSLDRSLPRMGEVRMKPWT